MKSLSTIVKENLNIDSNILNESFASNKLSTIFSINKNSVEAKYFMRMLQWDKVTDDDIEVLSCEDARKIAYKRDSFDLILWIRGSKSLDITEEDKVIAASFGCFDVRIINKNAYSILPTKYRNISAKLLSTVCDKAIYIKDDSKFSTRELRAARSSAKENALALRDCQSIAEENRARYEQLKAEKTIGDDVNVVSIKAKVENVSALYMNFVDKFFVPGEDLKAKIFEFNKVNGLFSDIMEKFELIIRWSEDKVSILKLLRSIDKNIDDLKQVINKLEVKLS